MLSVKYMQTRMCADLRVSMDGDIALMGIYIQLEGDTVVYHRNVICRTQEAIPKLLKCATI